MVTCDCCGQQRQKLPFHHDAHDDSGMSWDYCQECYDTGCDLVTCSLQQHAFALDAIEFYATGTWRCQQCKLPKSNHVK